jgi:hypothetical protein
VDVLGTQLEEVTEQCEEVDPPSPGLLRKFSRAGGGQVVESCLTSPLLNDSLLPAVTLQTKFIPMSKAEILEQLPKLNSVELREICDRIWQLEEEQLLSGNANPSDEEKALLDSELEDYSRNREAGASWEEVKSRLMQ